MAREINLVPDIKNEMIKTLKLRNLIFFICVVVASASVIVTFVFGAIVGGQQIAINSKDEALEAFSERLNSYADLNDFLTIKDQLGNIASITKDKKLTSRTFNILSALIPTGPDEITISELNINLFESTPSFTLEAQANAGQPPFIDYTVLDSFKKSMQYMRYDYGNYVDKDGNNIPAYCMIERGPDGGYLVDSTRGMYAYWTIFAEGCNNIDQELLDEALGSDSAAGAESMTNLAEIAGHTLESYAGNRVVRIWRTPQFDDWYEQSYLTKDGKISGVNHFKSSCISYSGEEKNDKIKWTDPINSCLLVPNGDNGISINGSSNGRNALGELVLRFSATIQLAPEAFDFNKHHLIALAPSERRNVTDSYVQLQTIFGERAKDCQEGDTACIGNGGNQ